MVPLVLARPYLIPKYHYTTPITHFEDIADFGKGLGFRDLGLRGVHLLTVAHVVQGFSCQCTGYFAHMSWRVCGLHGNFRRLAAKG